MKLHFVPNLDYQLAAIESVCNLFRGQEICRARPGSVGDRAYEGVGSVWPVPGSFLSKRSARLSFRLNASFTRSSLQNRLVGVRPESGTTREPGHLEHSDCLVGFRGNG